MKYILLTVLVFWCSSSYGTDIGPGILPPGVTDPNQALLDAIQYLQDATVGSILALIVAVTWKG